jgi:hypothetical protein
VKRKGRSLSLCLHPLKFFKQLIRTRTRNIHGYLQIAINHQNKLKRHIWLYKSPTSGGENQQAAHDSALPCKHKKHNRNTQWLLQQRARNVACLLPLIKQMLQSFPHFISIRKEKERMRLHKKKMERNVCKHLVKRPPLRLPLFRKC